jgi:alkylated DNA nucleotide flippase Atl1
MKYTRQLADAPAGSFHVLDEEKAKRLNAKTLYIPSPLEVRDVISAIPSGTVWTVVDMRRKLAADHDADTACPAAIQKYWRWMAWAMETESGAAFPWWRVTRRGEYSDQLPGGRESHRARLAAEGVTLKG